MIYLYTGSRILGTITHLAKLLWNSSRVGSWGTTLKCVSCPGHLDFVLALLYAWTLCLGHPLVLRREVSYGQVFHLANCQSPIHSVVSSMAVSSVWVQKKGVEHGSNGPTSSSECGNVTQSLLAEAEVPAGSGGTRE
jgi:hypothetical protein